MLDESISFAHISGPLFSALRGWRAELQRRCMAHTHPGPSLCSLCVYAAYAISWGEEAKRIARSAPPRLPNPSDGGVVDERGLEVTSSGEVTLSRSITLSHLGVADAVTCISSFESASLHASVDFALFAN
jgi:hypothetical protein